MQDQIVGAGAGSGMAARVARVICGNFLEMFDFFVYGFYASIISKVLFPAGDEYFVTDTRHHFSMHSFVKVEAMTAEALLRQQSRRLPAHTSPLP